MQDRSGGKVGATKIRYLAQQNRRATDVVLVGWTKRNNQSHSIYLKCDMRHQRKLWVTSESTHKTRHIYNASNVCFSICCIHFFSLSNVAHSMYFDSYQIEILDPFPNRLWHLIPTYTAECTVEHTKICVWRKFVQHRRLPTKILKIHIWEHRVIIQSTFFCWVVYWRERAIEYMIEKWKTFDSTRTSAPLFWSDYVEMINRREIPCMAHTKYYFMWKATSTWGHFTSTRQIEYDFGYIHSTQQTL